MANMAENLQSAATESIYYPELVDTRIRSNGNIRLLAIEDNPGDRLLLQNYISSFDQPIRDIRFAETLEQAKALLSSTEFDIILLDFYLPDGTGPDFMKEMKDNLEIPVIVLTGQKDRKVEREVLDSGAADFIPKQEMTPTLLERVLKFTIERNKTYNMLREQTLRDPLTGLYNRLGMENILARMPGDGTKKDTPFALLLIDVDKFKSINDTYGHAAGDTILKIVARIIRSSARISREKDYAIRIGGDEFALIITELQDIQNIYLVINRLTENFSNSFEVDGYEIGVSLSIGIAIYPDDGTEPKEIMTNADFSLYRAKKKTGTAFEFFDKGMHNKIKKKHFIENSLTQAIKDRQFLLYYQPKYNTEDCTLNGFEALVRWNHPEMGIIWPREFIHIMEETGHILEVGEWVLLEACRQCAEWQKITGQLISVSVNVSIRQLLHNSYTDSVQRILAETGLPPESLELEITESLVIQNINQSNKVLRKLRKTGISISLDDFGTGYSSLSRLRALPIDKLKMDRSLIRKVGKNRFDTAIARTVLSLARFLRISAVAEGVETEEQYRFLKNAGCPEVQGYYFSKPLPAEEIEASIFDHSRPILAACR